jgi:hypothetical protein
MAFQSTINSTLASGVPGELLLSGPFRGAPYILNSASAAYNLVGATAFTTSDGLNAAAGGTIGDGTMFAGLLANPKVYATSGTTSGTLAPTLTLPNNFNAEFVTMGFLNVTLPGACSVGDLVYYDTTSGALGTVGPYATGTATQSTTTLTVATSTGGNIGIGTKMTIAGADEVEVIALGSGTGGTGTYTVNVSQSVSPAAAFSGNSQPASGKAFVPRCVVDRFPLTGAGVTVVRLSN